MKRTIHINITGHAFSIDEDAFEKLKKYLEAVEAVLGGSNEAKETLDDINLRIAELFRGGHRDASSPITMGDVEEVIKTLGDPNDYKLSEDSEPPNEEKPSFDPLYRKKLFRDPDNRFLGGVCGGLANFFNINSIVFRLLFIFATFFLYGTPILIYIILWIALPKAVTVPQRIMMMGEAPGKEYWRRKRMHPYETLSVKRNDYTLLGVVAGTILIFISFVMLTVLTVTFTMPDLLTQGLNFSGLDIYLQESLFHSQTHRILAFIGLGLTIGVPLLVILFLGLHLVFHFKHTSNAFVIVALVLWLVGIAMAVTTGIYTVKDSFFTSTITREFELNIPSADTIYIEPNNASLNMNADDDIKGTPNIKLIYNEPTFMMQIKKKASLKNGVLYEHRYTHSTHNKNIFKKVLTNASWIEYFYLQKDSTLLLDRFFTVDKSKQLINPEINVTISIPEGKEVEIAEELLDFIENDSR